MHYNLGVVPEWQWNLNKDKVNIDKKTLEELENLLITTEKQMTPEYIMKLLMKLPKSTQQEIGYMIISIASHKSFNPEPVNRALFNFTHSKTFNKKLSKSSKECLGAGD